MGWTEFSINFQKTTVSTYGFGEVVRNALGLGTERFSFFVLPKYNHAFAFLNPFQSLVPF